MTHSEHSEFKQGKAEAYNDLLLSAESLFQDQRNWVCNLANASSLLWHLFKAQKGSPCEHVNWAGFYVMASPDTLLLGPFQGKVACQEIKLGRGVCGAAAAQCKTQLVDDVEKFPGHIACDGDTKSEIVVPIMQNGEIRGVIDIDCLELSGFDSVDQENLEKLAELIAKSSDFSSV